MTAGEAAPARVQPSPGDPVRASLGATAPAALVEARREAMGLNDPLWLQYGHYLRDLLSGELGTSMGSGLPVSEVIGDRLPATVQLAVAAFLVALLIAIPLGVCMAVLTRGGRRRGHPCPGARPRWPTASASGRLCGAQAAHVRMHRCRVHGAALPCNTATARTLNRPGFSGGWVLPVGPR